MNAFACMMPYSIGGTYPPPSGAALFTPPMKTWMEHVADELGCQTVELSLCRKVEPDGTERWWWEKREQKLPAQGCQA